MQTKKGARTVTRTMITHGSLSFSESDFLSSSLCQKPVTFSSSGDLGITKGSSGDKPTKRSKRFSGRAFSSFASGSLFTSAFSFTPTSSLDPAPVTMDDPWQAKRPPTGMPGAPQKTRPTKSRTPKKQAATSDSVSSGRREDNTERVMVRLH